MQNYSNSVIGIDLGAFKTIISKNKESLQIFNGEREVRSVAGFQESGVRTFFQENQFKKSMINHIVLSPLLLDMDKQQDLVGEWLFFGETSSLNNQ